jgi:TRAP-type uncharacterized transport system substrate-binding protein
MTHKRKKNDIEEQLVNASSVSSGGVVNHVRLLLCDELDVVASLASLDATNTRRLQAFTDKLRAVISSTTEITVIFAL